MLSVDLQASNRFAILGVAELIIVFISKDEVAGRLSLCLTLFICSCFAQRGSWVDHTECCPLSLDSGETGLNVCNPLDVDGKHVGLLCFLVAHVKATLCSWKPK